MTHPGLTSAPVGDSPGAGDGGQVDGSAAGIGGGPSAGHGGTASQRPTTQASAQDTADLLALVAQAEATAFLRLATAANEARDSARRLRLSRLAGAALARQEAIVKRMAALVDGAEAAEQHFFKFDGAFDDFNQRMQARSSGEELLKGYVGQGVADDFCRLVSVILDDESREAIERVLTESTPSDSSVDALDIATTDDDVLASRLALWGRRLAGEALSALQTLLSEHESLQRLVTLAVAARLTGGDEPAPALDNAWIFSQLTAEHTRRMGRLGLAA